MTLYLASHADTCWSIKCDALDCRNCLRHGGVDTGWFTITLPEFGPSKMPNHLCPSCAYDKDMETQFEPVRAGIRSRVAS